MQMKSLEARIRALSPLQQQLLAHRLDSHAESGLTSQPLNAHSAEMQDTRTQLVAYYSLKGNHTDQHPTSTESAYVDGIDEAELVSLVDNALPEYMKPARWVALDALPRLPNGKFALALLPLPPDERAVTAIDTQDNAEHTHFPVLAEILGSLLGFADIRPEDNFFELGGDSITAMQFVSKAREAGIMIDVASVTARPTIAALAEFSEPDVIKETEASPHGRTPLTPIQSWFFGIGHKRPDRWNLGGVLYFTQPLDTKLLRDAILVVSARHPALGSSFSFDGDQWRASIPHTPPPAGLLRFSKTVLEAEDEDLQYQIQQLQQEFVLKDGWLIRFQLREADDICAGRLVWVVHHLIMDAISVNQFFSQVASCYRNLQGGLASPDQPVGSISLREWALRLKEIADKRKVSTPESPAGTHRLPSKAVFATEADSSTEVIELSVQTTQTLLDAGSSFNTGTHELILCALGMTLCELARIAQVTIDVEHHGRDLLGQEADTSESIGWFTSFFPFSFTREESADWREQVRWVKESLRSSRMDKRYHLLEKTVTSLDPGWSTQATDHVRWPTHPDFEFPTILFNFQGSQDIARTDVSDGLWSLKLEPWEFLRSPDNFRSHGLEMNAWVAECKLYISFRYAHASADSELISDISQTLQKNLVAIIASSSSGQPMDYAPSDFPDIEMDQEELDDFINSLNQHQ